MCKVFGIYAHRLKYKKSLLRQEGSRICTVYFLFGFIWIYISDRIVSNIIRDPQKVLMINTYKGILYVFCTALILYHLISNLIKKVELAEEKLNRSNEDLLAANEELQAYIEQLTASEEELRCQYDQIVEFDRKLSLSEERYKVLIHQMQLGVALYEGDSHDDIGRYKLIEVNHCHEVLTGFKNDTILGKRIYEIHSDLDKNYMEKLVRTIQTGEPSRYERSHNNTDYFYEIIAYRPMENQLAVIVNDITKRKQAEERLHYLSCHDQLTGLYNRRYFEKQLIQLDSPEYYPLMITMGDINGLKLMNDSFGHTAGDKYIQKAACVIMEGCRKKDVICRLGGDEFILFSPNTDVKEIKGVINHINELAGKEAVNLVTLSISFGYCAKYSAEESISEILKKAEDYMYRKKLLESPCMRGKTIYAIMAALHEKNPREEQHSHRVSGLCEKMGMVMGLQQDEIKELKTVGLLHDIGKVAIDEGILNKNGKLTEEEWEEIKRHPEIGYRILSTVNELSEMAEYVLAHHERWDGKGYPKGLKGEEIPIQSRIISVADAYDAMISERSYRKALSKEYAVSELRKGAGTQFSEACVNIFIEKVINDDI